MEGKKERVESKERAGLGQAREDKEGRNVACNSVRAKHTGHRRCDLQGGVCHNRNVGV